MGIFSFLAGKPKVPKDSGSLISPVQNLFREYPEDTITPVRYRDILHDADIGLTYRYMELLDAASTDAKVASVLRTRKLAVAGADFHVEPGDESDLAMKIAEETEEFIEAIPNLRQFWMDLLDAHYRGFACIRPVWAVVNGLQKVVDYEPIESRFFRFDNAATPMIVTQNNPQGEPMPPEYLFHVVRDKPGPVTRGGTGRSIGKLWLYKGYNLVDLASYLEKFGQPHVQVKIPLHYVEGSPELERAKSAARSLISDNIGLVPADVTLELLETIKQTSTVNDTYLAFMRWCDEGIAQAELGHSLTSAASNVGGLGHGQEAQQAGEVRQDIKQYDAQGFINQQHSQLIWPRTVRQYGPTAPLPFLCLDVEQPEDQAQVATAQKLRAETIAILKGAGLDVSKRQIYQEFKLEEPDSEDDKLIGSVPAPAPILNKSGASIAPQMDSNA